MAEDTITIPDDFRLVEEQDVTIPDDFQPVQPSVYGRAYDKAEEAANLGMTYMQGRTFGLGNKAMSGIGAAEAKLLMEGAEKASKLGNLLGVTDSEYEAPSYVDLYKKIYRDAQGKVDQSYEDHPYLSMGAEAVGAIRTGSGIGKTKYGQKFSNWIGGGKPKVGAPLSERAANVFLKKPLKQGLVGGVGYSAYKQGIADPDEQGEGMLQDFATGGAISGGLGLAGSGLSAGIKAATPATDDALTAVVELAKKHKIPTSLDQITDSKALKNIQKISQELPFSGYSKFRGEQVSAFNRALTKTIGQESDRITPELMDKAFTDVGKQFDDFAKGKNYRASDFKKQIDSLMGDADEVYSKEAVDAFKMRVGKIINEFDDTGIIKGSKLNSQRAKINALARKANDPDKQAIFRDLEDAIIETVTQGDDKAIKNILDAKQKYKNLIVLEPLAAKSKGGSISIPQLNTRVSRIYGRQHVRGKAGDIGDLARIGNELLPELGGSDTTQKLMTAGYLGGSIVDPTMGAQVGAGLAANRGFQKWFNQNQKSIERSLMKAYEKQLKAPNQKAIESTLKGIE